MTPNAHSSRLLVAIASGKGGTGKTLIATNLAVAAARAGSPAVLVDCDAEAPNDALFVHPVGAQCAPVTVPAPVVSQDKCILCGACRNACAYGAIRILGGNVIVFNELCHSCGQCVHACVLGALREEPRRVGEVEWGKAHAPLVAPAGLTVVTGRLDVGEVKTPAIVRAARKRGAVSMPAVTVLDAPPGVGCATVAAIRGSDVLVLVTEPTPFGLHDLQLAVTLARGLGIPCGVVINRAEAGAGQHELEAYCERESLRVLAQIPFDRRIAQLYATGELIIEGHPDGPSWFSSLWQAIRRLQEEEA